ncbi:prepilin peptidase [Stomatohabitans albus]|uniref:prepilin peptidase n=1 Tax=Stomatohabitans albus TaxID=3110766 RepID=UPI00300D87DE
MSPLIIALIGGLFGLLLGSFANVVIARVPKGESVVSPPSACPHCGHQIGWRDNIPILSYLLLGGKCRSCHTAISARYPIVEGVMALLFGGYSYWFASIGDLYALPGILAFVFASMCLLVIDIDTFRLPNAITVPLMGTTLVLFSAAALFHGETSRFWSMLFGPVFLAGILYIAHRIRPSGMGMGDVKYAIPMGITLGYLGIGPVIVGYFLALFVGVGWGITTMAKHGFKRRVPMPFGPGLVIGAFAAIIVGNQIARLYMSITGL